MTRSQGPIRRCLVTRVRLPQESVHEDGRQPNRVQSAILLITECRREDTETAANVRLGQKNNHVQTRSLTRTRPTVTSDTAEVEPNDERDENNDKVKTDQRKPTNPTRSPDQLTREERLQRRNMNKTVTNTSVSVG